MKLLVSLIIVFIICQLFGKNIKKHAPLWYTTLFLIALLTMFIPAAPMWLQQLVNGYITRGTFATAMFIWVMYARILPKGTKTMANFMSLRAPLAIGATMLILIHNVFYLIQYVSRMLNGKGLSSLEIFAGVFSLAMVFLVLPLTATSFMTIRKKMNPVTWKKLQRLSYIFYGLIYLHVFLLFSRQILNGHANYARELAIYTAVFGFYLVKRVALSLEMRKKKLFSTTLVKVGLPMLVTICMCIFFWPYALNNNAKAEQASDESIIVSDSNESPEVMGVYREEKPDKTDGYVDGEYTGSAMGYNGPITVVVTVTDGKIARVKVVSGEDDDPYYTWAIKEIPGAIEKANSPDVDTVSGATTSSKAIISAVKDALKISS